VDLLGNADSYATLHASVLMGSFHDHRQRRDDEHGIVSKSLSGTGEGSIEIDVVKGQRTPQSLGLITLQNLDRMGVT